DVASRLVTAGGGAPAPYVMALKPVEPLRRVREPGAAADVTVATCVAVRKQVKAGPHLVGEIRRDSVSVLLAKGNVGHGKGKRPALQVGTNRVGGRQRAGDGREQRTIFRDGQHGGSISGRAARASLFSRAILVQQSARLTTSSGSTRAGSTRAGSTRA